MDDKRGLERPSHLVTNLSDRNITFISNVKLGNNLNVTLLSQSKGCVSISLFIYLFIVDLPILFVYQLADLILVANF